MLSHLKNQINYQLSPEVKISLHAFLNDLPKISSHNEEQLIGLTGILAMLNLYHHMPAVDKMLCFYEQSISSACATNLLLQHSNVRNLDTKKSCSFLHLLNHKNLCKEISLVSYVTTNILAAPSSIQFKYYQALHQQPINQTLINLSNLRTELNHFCRQNFKKEYQDKFEKHMDDFISVAENVQLNESFSQIDQGKKNLKKL